MNRRVVPFVINAIGYSAVNGDVNMLTAYKFPFNALKSRIYFKYKA